jgi:hypothetical protein
MSLSSPTGQDACRLVERALGIKTVTARRFPTGLCHFVYDLELADGRWVVARLAGASSPQYLAGGVYWQTRLRQLGVPLAAQLFADLRATIPHVILERLPGDDLGNVYSTLDDDQKKAVAAAVVGAQRIASRLPEASGFGHAFSYEDPALSRHPSWREVIEASLERSRQRMASSGAVDSTTVDRVYLHLRKFEAYFSRVHPKAFLADTTTKNVIVHEGRFAGIVDVDEVCFGDPLLTIGLTQMALLDQGYDTTYVSHWLSLVEASGEERAVVDLYTAVFCADFLGEQGQIFNRGQIAADLGKIASLKQILTALLGRL